MSNFYIETNRANLCQKIGISILIKRVCNFLEKKGWARGETDRRTVGNFLRLFVLSFLELEFLGEEEPKPKKKPKWLKIKKKKKRPHRRILRTRFSSIR